MDVQTLLNDYRVASIRYRKCTLTLSSWEIDRKNLIFLNLRFEQSVIDGQTDHVENVCAAKNENMSRLTLWRNDKTL